MRGKALAVLFRFGRLRRDGKSSFQEPGVFDCFLDQQSTEHSDLRPTYLGPSKQIEYPLCTESSVHVGLVLQQVGLMRRAMNSSFCRNNGSLGTRVLSFAKPFAALGRRRFSSHRDMTPLE